MKAGLGLADAFEANLAAEHNHGFKKRRRVLAPANGDPDGLKHRTGLESERSGGLAQRLIERIVIERRCGQDLLGMLQDFARKSGIASLGRDQLGGVVGSELVEKEEVGG